jgi:glycosyltransferase involved in cell wall biosynthesis
MLAAPQDALDAITNPALAPLFRQPSRVGVASAWYGHVPFGYWLAAQARPRTIVELGTHNGVSYSAFCDAVLDQHLPTRCFAVDTWQGDPQTGLYGEEVFADLHRFHNQRFAAFSTLLRMTFDEALTQMSDASVDLLHIDGEHSYPAVRHDFETWLPKLSDRGIVLFHDINVREQEYGVWALWDEIRKRYPNFEFLHASGLGLLAIGEHAPPCVAALCAETDDSAIATVRERFARLGERCEFQYVAGDLEATREQYHAELAGQVDIAERKATEAAAEAERFWRDATKAWDEMDVELKETRRQLHQTRRELDDTRAAWSGARRAHSDVMRQLKENDHQLDLARRLLDDASRRAPTVESIADQNVDASADNEELAQQVDAMHCELQQARNEIARLSQERDIILGSTLWRATTPLRLAARSLPLPIRRGLRGVLQTVRRSASSAVSLPPAQPPDSPPEIPAQIETVEPCNVAAPIPEADVPAPAELSTLTSADEPDAQLVIISGEPDIPGHVLRVLRHVSAAKSLGVGASWMKLAEVPVRRNEITHASVVMIWRAVNCPEVADAIVAARAGGAKLIFDIDDLMFKPELATEKIIDGIRTQGLSEQEVASYYQRVKDVVVQMDACSCTTEELARHLHELDRTTFVLPNCFDATVLTASRLAVRRRVPADEGIVRIGYAAGTRTHQRDFRPAAEALGRILRDRPKCRLVLFRAPGGGAPQLDPTEFPALADHDARIEWRELVPLAELPNELVRFDINLAPLEIGNPFCEAKSELKYYEAALVDVCTIASPTGPMRRAIRDGETGRLADTPDAWYKALRELVDDRQLRQHLGRSAYHDVLARFGPRRTADALLSMLRQLAGDEEAVRTFELDLLRRQSRAPTKLDIPESDIVFSADSFGAADVTVVIPLYNYAQFIEEALDSVRNQTLTAIDLVVVDDASTDASLDVALAWIRQNVERFNRVVVARNRANAGLARSRNVGFDRAETQYVLPLDADNRLLPNCCERLLRALRESQATFAYPEQQCFGTADHVIGTDPFTPRRFACGNYIDAMALVEKSAWATVGGYTHIQYGWEDYDFWCCCVEHGLRGCHVPEILAEYRFHDASMRVTRTDKRANNLEIIEQLEERHFWLSLTYRNYIPEAPQAVAANE